MIRTLTTPYLIFPTLVLTPLFPMYYNVPCLSVLPPAYLNDYDT